MVGQEFSQLYGKNNIVYVNIGNAQGVKVGDYLRIFRYQGSLAETAPNTKGYQYKLYGFGSTPTRYEWNDLPREVLGEGIVINLVRIRLHFLSPIAASKPTQETTSRSSNSSVRLPNISGPRCNLRGLSLLGHALGAGAPRFRR